MIRRTFLSPASVAPAQVGAWQSDEDSELVEKQTGSRLATSQAVSSNAPSPAQPLSFTKRPFNSRIRLRRASVVPILTNAADEDVQKPTGFSKHITAELSPSLAARPQDETGGLSTVPSQISSYKQNFECGELMRKVRASTHRSLDVRLFRVSLEKVADSKWKMSSRDTNRSLALSWIDQSSPLKRGPTVLNIDQIVEVTTGHATAGFQQAKLLMATFPPPDLCFSCVSSRKTVDIIANSPEQCQAWVLRIQSLLQTTRASGHDSLDDMSIFQLISQGNLDKIEQIFENSLVSLNDLHPTTGDSPLLYACRNNKSAVALEMLVRGASVDPHSRWGQTALQIAVDNGHLECVRTLLSAARKFGRAADLVNTKCRDDKGRTAVHLASKRGDVQILHLLLEVGGDPLALDRDMRSALHLAALAAGGVDKVGSYPHIAKYPHGHRPPLALPPSPLRMHHAQCIELLCDGGAARLVGAGDSFARAALHYAAISGDVDMVEVLLGAGGNPLVRDNTGATAFDIAASRGFSEVCEVLQTASEQLAAQHTEQLFLTTPETNRHSRRRRSSARQQTLDSDGESEVSTAERRSVRKNRRRSAKRTRKRGLFEGLGQHITADPFQNNASPWVLQTSMSPEGAIQWLENTETGEIVASERQTLPPLLTTLDSKGFYAAELSSIPITPPLFPSPKHDAPSEDAVWDQCGSHSFVSPTGRLSDKNWADATPSQDALASEPLEKPYAPHEVPAQSVYDAPDEYDGPNGGFMGDDGYEYYHDEVNDDWYYFDEVSQNWALWTDDNASAAEYVEGALQDSDFARGAPTDALSNTQSFPTSPGNRTKSPALQSSGTPQSSSNSAPHSNLDRSHSCAVKSAQITDSFSHQFEKTKPEDRASNTDCTKQLSIPEATDHSLMKAKSAAPLESALSALHQPQFDKYKRMLRMGIPLPAVEGKLKMDAVDEAEAARFMGAASDFLASHDKSELDGGMAQAAAPDAVAAISTASFNIQKTQISTAENKSNLLKEFPGLEKYAKMVKMGAPLGAAKGKMQQDGKGADIITRFIRAFARNESEAAPLLEGMQGGIKPSRPLPSGPRPAPSSASKRKARVQLLKLHWTPLPTDLVQSSVWGSNRLENMDSASELDDNSLQELQARFGVKRALAKTAGPKKTAVPAPRTVYLIDSKRANNVGIGLAQFKHFCGAKGVLEAVLDASGTPWADPGNVAECKVSNIQLEALLGLLPDSVESRTLSNYKGDRAKLGPVEKWFDQVRRIPRPAAKVSAAGGLRQLQPTIATCFEQAELLLGTNSQIMKSAELRAVLTTILAVGNAMNEGTANGGVSGFTLDSVLRLTATKAADKKTTLMDYVVEAVVSKQGISLAGPMLLLLRPLRKAKRIAVADICALLSSANSYVAKAQAEAQKMRKDQLSIVSSEPLGLSRAASAGGAAAGSQPLPDEPVQPPPANAFLASIRNAGGKRNVSKPAASVSKPHMDLLGEECTAAFEDCVQHCAAAVRPRLEELQALVSEVERSDKELALYFAEKDGSARVHAVLAQFIAELHSSADRLESKILPEVRSAASAPPPPPAAFSGAGAVVPTPVLGSVLPTLPQAKFPAVSIPPPALPKPAPPALKPHRTKK